MADTLYDILGIPNGSGDILIKRKYRELARRYHPDTRDREVNQEEYDQVWLKIQTAYEVLSDPDQKARYDLANEIFEENAERIEESDDNSFGWNIPYPTPTPYTTFTSGSSSSSMAYTSGSMSYHASSLSGYTVSMGVGIAKNTATISFRVMNAAQYGLIGLVAGQIVYITGVSTSGSIYSSTNTTIHLFPPASMHSTGVIKHVAYGVAVGLQAYMDIEIEIL